MNKQKQKDLKQGLEMEDILKPVFENKFGELNKTHHYHSFDFENDNVLIELKTRNINWGQYDSLMFSKKKIDYLRNNNITKDAYFFFKLKDGLFIIMIYYLFHFNMMKNQNIKMKNNLIF